MKFDSFTTEVERGLSDKGYSILHPGSRELAKLSSETRIAVAAAVKDIIQSDPNIQLAVRQGRLNSTLDFLNSTKNPIPASNPETTGDEFE
ncbi:hypothetical protein [Streptomyces sp. NPDC088847]|uniref:hypothetical protein n=1 Tax=Streptomyces sp. NPDC088847 TaxID=3365909 RepID=UPI00380E1846